MPKQHTLHAIIDPLCGWCYAAAALLDAAKAQLSIQVHGGGLLVGERRRTVSADFRTFILTHVERIQQTSGQTFTPAFTDGLLCDTSLVLDSVPPIAAILAVQTLGGDAVQMLHDMQIAYYQQGKHLSDIAHLSSIAAQQNIDKTQFETAFEAALLQVDAHISSSRKLLAQVGSQSFPTFVLETQSGDLVKLEHQSYYGRVADWQTYLQERLQSA